MAWKLSKFLKGNSLLLSQFSYCRDPGTGDALISLSHDASVPLDGGMEETLVQLDFSAAFDRVSHRGLLYTLKSIDVGGQFWYIVSQCLSDTRGSACVWVVRSVC